MGPDTQEAKERFSRPYRTHAAEAESLYDSACELWQSVLDEYGISCVEIGLAEPLLERQEGNIDFCGVERAGRP